MDRNLETKAPAREELLLLTLALSTDGCDRQQFLSVMVGQPDEAVKRAFNDTTVGFTE